MKPKKKMLMVAVVGIGQWGKKLITEFNKVSTVRYALNSADKENLSWLRNYDPTIKHDNTFQEILNDSGIDAVVIATPINTHYEFTRQILSSGKNVFVEKPPTTDSDQLVKLIELAKKQNLSLFTNNTFLYDPFYKKIINAIKDKKINYLNLIWLKYGSFKEDITWNLGYHYLAIILSLINQEPKIVNTEIQENRFFLDLEFASKLRCNVFIDRKYSAKATRLININYKNKQILWTKDNLFCVDNGEVNKTSSEGNISPLESIVTDFTKDLNQNSKDYRNIELSLKVVNLIEKIHNFQ